MKKNNKFGIFLLVSVFVMALVLFGCAAGTPAATPSSQPVATTGASASASAAATSSATGADKTFTAAELAKYDGQNGNPAYVAVSGVVYDVSNVPQWSGGSHHGHTAGTDMTKQIGQSPHGTAVLKNLPIVGKYVG